MKILASAIVQLVGSSEQESQARFQREPLTIQDLNCPEFVQDRSTNPNFSNDAMDSGTTILGRIRT